MDRRLDGTILLFVILWKMHIIEKTQTSPTLFVWEDAADPTQI